MVADEPATTRCLRHLGQVHRTDSHQETNTKATDESSTLEHSKRIGASLKSTTEHRQECAKLNIRATPQVVAGPHQEETTNSTSSTEQTIGSRLCRSGGSFIAWFTLRRKVEVGEPARLTDGT